MFFEINKDKTKVIMPINDLASICGYFYNANFNSDYKQIPNNGYNCRHPDCLEQLDGIGCCFTWGCPLGFEADEEDCLEFGLEHEEGEFIITDNKEIIEKLFKLN